MNSIDTHGKAYNDSFLGKYSTHCTDLVAKEKGLTQAREIFYAKENSLKQAHKQTVKQIREVLAQAQPNTVREYVNAFNTEGKAHGIRAKEC